MPNRVTTFDGSRIVDGFTGDVASCALEVCGPAASIATKVEAGDVIPKNQRSAGGTFLLTIRHRLHRRRPTRYLVSASSEGGSALNLMITFRRLRTTT